MPLETQTVPSRKELLIDLLAFGGTVIVAVVEGWRATDIVWASWITSLLLGLSFFLVLSLRMLADYALALPRSEPDQRTGVQGGLSGAEGDAEVPEPMDSRPGCLGLAVGGLMGLLAWLVGPGTARAVLLFLVGLDLMAMVIAVPATRGWFGMSLRLPWARACFYLPTALFLFFFFLLHFGVFHLGHAVFLGFFVVPEVEFTVAADSIVGIRETLVGIREGTFAFLGGLILTYWAYVAATALRSVGAFGAALAGHEDPKNLMILPYKRVIRVHLLIFALIPLAAFDSGLVMTMGVLFFFFFPVESVVAWLKSR